MRRKKTKAKPKKSAALSLNLLEKNFKSLPNQITAQCKREINALKKQQKELSSALKKAQTLAATIQKKCDELAQGSPTTAARKKLISTKKGLVKAQQAVKAMNTELSTLQKNADTLSEMQHKYAAFSKEWANFKAPRAVVVKKTKKSDKIAGELQPTPRLQEEPTLASQDEEMSVESETV